jgi:hypothetical protein
MAYPARHRAGTELVAESRIDGTPTEPKMFCASPSNPVVLDSRRFSLNGVSKVLESAALPFGRGGMLAKNVNGAVDRIIGGWEVAGVLLFQSGPFLTATVPGPDPQGTNFSNLIGDVRPDIVSGVSLYPTTQTWANWLNPAAFKAPGDNIGRFGKAPVGNIVGPGTQAVSVSLMKSIKFTENMGLQFGAQAANLFNLWSARIPSGPKRPLFPTDNRDAIHEGPALM